MALFDNYIDSTKEKELREKQQAEENERKAEEEEREREKTEKQQHDLMIPYFIEALREMPNVTKQMQFSAFDFRKDITTYMIFTKTEFTNAVVFTRVGRVRSNPNYITTQPSKLMYTYQNEFIYPYTLYQPYRYGSDSITFTGEAVPVSVAAEVMYKEFIESINDIRETEKNINNPWVFATDHMKNEFYADLKNKYSYVLLFDQKAYKEAVIKYYELSFNMMKTSVLKNGYHEDM